MHTLIVDRMTVDARLPRADNALIDRLQRALQRWSDASRLGADDNLVARVLPALTLDLGRLNEDRLLDELGPRLDQALADALARQLPPPPQGSRREELARWLQHGAPLWSQPTLGVTALGALLYSELRKRDGAAWLCPLLARQAARARLLRLPAPLLSAILDWLEDSQPEPAAREAAEPAQRLARLLDIWDDALPRSGGERAHWRALLALIKQGLAQTEADDGWLDQLGAALAQNGAPPGLGQLLSQLPRRSRLPLQPDSARAREAVRALRAGEDWPAPRQLAQRLAQALSHWPRLAAWLRLLREAEQTLEPAALDAALLLWLADAQRLLPPQGAGWPQRSGDAIHRLRLALRELPADAAAPLGQALRQRLEQAAQGQLDPRALCDLAALPRFLASPALPARLADQIERFLAAAAPNLAWRRKLSRQLRLWSEGKSVAADYAWEHDCRDFLAGWRPRLQALPPSPVRDAALAQCAPAADRKRLAAALYALEKLLPALLDAHPQLPASPHLAAQLRRRRLKLWRGGVAAWQPLADTLAAQSANTDGIPGLWPDALALPEDELETRLRQQRDPALLPLWQAARAARRPLRGEERRQWQQAAASLQQLLDGQSLDEDSRFWADDAGLALLWPFLPELFRRCGWLDDGQRWRDENSQRKAWRALAGLLGRDEDQEQGYTARVLLGLEIDEPLADAPELSDAERGHLDEAVAAIEQAWAAALPAMPLRDGIGPLFLRRAGIWRLSQAGWQLTAQDAAQDVLLARLPWSLGVVMLPWLDGLITVNWPRPAIPAAPTEVTDPAHPDQEQDDA
ncbi:contractile injection system tape measure protein [Chromobacterium violaceum]|uniref:Uncharacterized protein n=1 Tax=Chromobacterium violaceum TaxID=536 RepID=A0A2R4K2L9_CHRVL|nr:contractile injection system tape measure protein [Chromobacterium violaceum]AVV48132.1 hypothetical protein [Chromobacterium violaceum]